MLAWADTRNGQAQHESVGHALAIIERLGYESGMWDTFIRTDSNIVANAPKKTDGSPASGGPNLSNVDAIFFMGHREVPLEESQKAELLQFVKDGKGFVAAHVALTALESWPEFGEMLGGRFDQHPISGPGTIVNESPNFPATKHFPATFAFNDEFYQPKDLSRDKVEVLLRLDLSNVPANPSLHLNGDYPLAWAKNYGKGRVFFGSFAHAAETWDIRARAADVFRGDALGARAHRRHAEPASDAALGRCAEVGLLLRRAVRDRRVRAPGADLQSRRGAGRSSPSASPATGPDSLSRSR